MKENCHNSRTGDDIDIKLGEVTKLDKRNETTSKKFDDDVMSENCEVIVIFWIFNQFEKSRGRVSNRESAKSYIFSNRTFVL